MLKLNQMMIHDKRYWLIFCTLAVMVFLLAYLYLQNNHIRPVRNFDDEKNEIEEQLPDRASHLKIYDTAGLVSDEDYSRIEDYVGLKVTWYGDSLTNQYNYCRIVDRYFKFIGHNSGISDTTITNINDSSMCMPIRMKYDVPEDIAQNSDIIFVMAGINDWTHNIPIGDVEKTFQDAQNGILENKTFAGACNQMFYYLKEGYPEAKIIVLGTPFAYVRKYGLFENTDGIRNELGLTSVDYGDVLCEAASLWGIANMNIGHVLEWNADNIYDYCTDGIHFDAETGSVEAAGVIINFIKGLNEVS